MNSHKAKETETPLTPLRLLYAAVAALLHEATLSLNREERLESTVYLMKHSTT
jgi:hypothetical protein